MNSRITVTLLGVPEVRSHGQVIDLPPQQLALLAVLVVEGPVSRARLASLFWPDKAESRAKASLNQLIHSLARSLGANVFGSRTGLSVVLDPAVVQTDVGAVENAERHEDWHKLIRLCKPTFLAGFPAFYGNDFEEWLTNCRRRFSDLLFQAVLASSRSTESIEHRIEHLALAHRLRPWDERVLREYLESLVASGRRAEALAVYEVFKHNLREELGASPSKTTREYHTSLLVESGAGTPVLATEAAKEETAKSTVPHMKGSRTERRKHAILSGCLMFSALLAGYVLQARLVGTTAGPVIMSIDPFTSQNAHSIEAARLDQLTTVVSAELSALLDYPVAIADSTGYRVGARLELGSNGYTEVRVSIRNPDGRTIGGGRVHLDAHPDDHEISQAVVSVASRELASALPHRTGAEELKLSEVRTVAFKGGIEAARALITRTERQYQEGVHSAWIRDSVASEAWQSRAWASIMSGDLSRAGEEYDSAISVLAHHASGGAQLRQARLLYLRWASDPGDSLALLHSAKRYALNVIERDPPSSEAFLLLAEITYALNEFDAAVAAASTARQYNPAVVKDERWESIYFLATLNAYQDREARRECDRIRSDSQLSWRAVMCTATLAALGDYASAETAALLMESSGDPLMLQVRYRPMLSALVGLAYGISGDRSQAMALLKATDGGGRASIIHVAALLTSVGERDRARGLIAELSASAAGQRQIRLNPRLRILAEGVEPASR